MNDKRGGFVNLFILKGILLFLMIAGVVFFLIYNYRFKKAIFKWRNSGDESGVEFEDVWPKKNDWIHSALIFILIVLVIIFSLIN